jgi:hypothetical protein
VFLHAASFTISDIDHKAVTVFDYALLGALPHYFSHDGIHSGTFQALSSEFGE